ncbi:MAG: hypothetical protein AB7F89_08070 [Pirellulaceae bacterium]
MLRTRGSLLLEASMALVLVALALTGIAQLVLLAGRQQQALAARRVAVLEANNLLEKLMRRPFDELTPSALAEAPAYTSDLTLLRHLRTSIDVHESTDSPRSKQIDVQLRWHTGPEMEEAVRVVGWKYANEPTGDAP